MVKIRNITSLILEHFPMCCAEDWDNPGLQLGREGAPVTRVLVALELTRDVFEEAREWGAELILTHHPFIFKPIKSVTDASCEGRLLLDLAEAHIGLLAAHTNLDSVPHGIGEKLARDLGLSGLRPVVGTRPFEAYKIVTFIPEADAEQVVQAMHAQGAGCVGQYRDVSFWGTGEGRFTGDASSHPAIGVAGEPERVREVRVEMIVSSRELGAVTRALLETHPYEEPAYDVFKLESQVHGLTDVYGFGVAGRLAEAVELSDLISRVREVWQIDSVRAAGDPHRRVLQVAILNGSGARYLGKCAAQGIDAYITGDCGHHDFDAARRLGIALIDAGHYDTEKCIPNILADVLRQSKYGAELDVRVSTRMENPMRVYGA